MSIEDAATILPEPPPELKSISARLCSLIHDEITRHGPMPFARFMEMALYEPGLGYYSAGLQKFGQDGDFVTAPQLGDVFARCLANQARQVADEIGNYEIVEAGAGTGALAADLLKALEDTHPPERYRILERSAHLRQVQYETLSQCAPQWLDKVSWLDQPPQTPWQGLFLANEVLDALTVERFEITGQGPRQLRVAADGAGFDWRLAPCPPALHGKIERLLHDAGSRPATGYRSELNPHLGAWLDAVTNALRKGLALFIDYGYTRRDYYSPARRDGTLICHYRHRVHSDPFSWPGLTDISASVDFTALAEAADDCGLDVCGYTTQAMFLLASGLGDILRGLDDLDDAERLGRSNEIRRLTLPGEMGERFQLMALARGLDDELCGKLRGFADNDMRYRL